MKTEVINGNTVMLYDNIGEMPLLRYYKANHMLMIAAQVGNTIEDYNERTRRTIHYVSSDNKKDALTELSNRQQCVFNAMNQYDPYDQALALWVHSVNGVECKKIDQNSLNELLGKLSDTGLSKNKSLNIVDAIKKKLKKSYESFLKKIFPT